MPHSAPSDLVLHCLPMSNKKDAMLKWLNVKARCVLIRDINQYH